MHCHAQELDIRPSCNQPLSQMVMAMQPDSAVVNGTISALIGSMPGISFRSSSCRLARQVLATQTSELAGADC